MLSVAKHLWTISVRVWPDLIRDLAAIWFVLDVAPISFEDEDDDKNDNEILI